MNNRRYKRIIAGYKAEITYHDECYFGVIENLSETGVNILTDLLETSIDFQAGESISLKVDIPAGSPLMLKCTIKWAQTIQPHNLRHRIGLEIIDPPWDKNSYFL
ncbi:MAG: PilZ domain-containing protein [Nitrospirota bacterium]